MDAQSFPCDQDVLARFPGARSYERDTERTTYLAERGGVRFLILVPHEGGEITVLTFADEEERAAYLTGRVQPA
ncbi:hypothetical protein J4573_29020 [Actinomadura barringtoniae]|uniref:Uncharacterized protein n=1 Tax=Actinomadura barringtoniae TaxID=1427535 RepID=A0A939PE49_9ACTN|nr:hypothetical protein [Actinomadura barringtoniae]MBO2451167.1 hypothetical protein [Actinomadura barringtoniae]